MKWITEPIPETGYSESMLALTPSEAGILAQVLRKPLKEHIKRLEHLDDVHDSGEATTRQEDRRLKLREVIAIIERFHKEAEL